MSNAALIYDVGMNNGDDTAYYLHRGHHVISIEADPTLAEQGARRFATAIAAGRLQILNVGVGPEEGVIPFWICEGKSEWNSFDQSLAISRGRRSHAIEIPCRKFAALLGEYGVPKYLKIDIEGNDKHCLDDLTAATRPQFISCELDGVPMLEQLKSLGYTRFKIILQNDFTQLRTDRFSWSHKALNTAKLYTLFYRLNAKRKEYWNRARQRRLEANNSASGAWTFNYGSSGPLSDDLPGEWQSFDDASQTWETFTSGRSVYGRPNLGLWFDVHATA